jgi:hypothetical protein
MDMNYLSLGHWQVTESYMDSIDDSSFRNLEALW